MKKAIRSLQFILALLVALTAFAGGREQASFTATVTGDVTGGPATRTNVIRSSSDQVVFSQPGVDLDLSYFEGITFKVPDDGGDCFYLGTYGPDSGGGSLVVKQERDGSATVDYWFYATANDRTTDIHYLLHMTGSFDDPTNWPPTVASTNTVRITSWEIQSEGKGADSRISCTGNGSFPSGVVVSVERTQ